MKQTVNLYDFRRAFEDHDRTNFSYEGLNILFDALTDFEYGGGEEIELDVIALCCEFVEMTADEVKDCYPASVDWESVEEYLQDNTWLCGSFIDGLDERFVFQQF